MTATLDTGRIDSAQPVELVASLLGFLVHTQSPKQTYWVSRILVYPGGWLRLEGAHCLQSVVAPIPKEFDAQNLYASSAAVFNANRWLSSWGDPCLPFAVPPHKVRAVVEHNQVPAWVYRDEAAALELSSQALQRDIDAYKEVAKKRWLPPEFHVWVKQTYRT